MNRFLNSLIAGLAGVILAGLCLGGAAHTHAGAGSALRYVSPAGSDSGSCSSAAAPCRTIQYAIHAANPGDEIRITGGLYAVPGVVAEITKALVLAGGYSPDFSTNNPDHFPSDLDAQNQGTVVVAQAVSAEVRLSRLNLQHGLGNANCSGQGCGGGIYAQDTRLVIENCNIRQNAGTSLGPGQGGGIYAYNSEVVIRFSSITSNTASVNASAANGSEGGGIFAIQGKSLLVHESQVEHNLGSIAHGASGGGIYASDLEVLELISSTLRFNTASLGPGRNTGGGAALIWVHSAFIRGNLILGNQLTGNTNPLDGFGGGLYVNTTRANFERNVFMLNSTARSNTYSQMGGAMRIDYDSPITFTNNLVIDNHAPEVGGIGINNPLTTGSRAKLYHNTFAANESLGLWISGLVTPTMVNNLLSNNDQGLSLYNLQGTGLVDHNLFSNTLEVDTGLNPILANPRLAPNFQLYAGSPALDSGLALPWLHDDLEGKPRPLGPGYDLGAFEGSLPQPRLFLPLVTLRGTISAAASSKTGR